MAIKSTRISETLLTVTGVAGLGLFAIDNAVTKSLLTYFFHIGKTPLHIDYSPLIIAALSAISIFLAFERRSHAETFGDATYLNFVWSISNDIKDRLLKEGKELATLEAWQRDDKFATISNQLLRQRADTLSNLAAGRLCTHLAMAPETQHLLMTKYKARMDAVSYDDLQLWSSIVDRNDIKNHHFDSDMGRQYYHVINQRRSLQNTVVTRIFVFSIQDLASEADLHLLAEVIDRHCQDNIGVAIAFMENLSTETKNIFTHGDGQKGRIDFALLNIDEVATFFRHNGGGPGNAHFEAVFRCSTGGAQIDTQRMLYKKLIVACTLATSQFEDQIKDAFTDDEWMIISSEIKRIRAARPAADRQMPNAPEQSLFSVPINFFDQDRNARLTEYKRRVGRAMEYASLYGAVV